MRRAFVPLLAAILLFGAMLSPAFAAAAVAPLSEFGSYGTGAGQMRYGSAVALDSEGRAYIADNEGERVDVFSAAGQFEFAFGMGVEPLGGNRCNVTTGCQIGKTSESAGAIHSPTGIAIGPDGRVYVSEWANNRVSVFSAEGGFLFAFGKKVNATDESDVCTMATGCQAGEGSGEAGALSSQFSLAFDHAGDLLVAERNRGRIDVFTPEGAFLRAYGKEVEPVHGKDVCTAATTCANGKLDGSGSALDANTVGVAPDGEIAVGEQDARVSVLSADGEWLFTFGANVNKGSGDPDICTEAAECKHGEVKGTAGAFGGELIGVAYETAGDILVPDFGNNRVAKYSPGGEFIEAFGLGVLDGKSEFQTCTTATGCMAGLGGPQPGSLSSPAGIALDCQGAFLAVESGDNLARVGRYGEPGAPSCGPPPAEEEAKNQPPGESRKPANGFRFGKLKLNKKRGTALLAVSVPGPGALALSGKGVRGERLHVPGVTTVNLPIALGGKAKKQLAKTGKRKVKVTVAFTPDGGTAASVSKSVSLKKTLKKSA